jgi:hypothetical protein
MNTTKTTITTSWESPGKNQMKVPFMSVKMWESGNSKYYFSERAGVDSVAFIFYDEQADLYGVINEFKPPLNSYLDTAFGGSLDSPNKSLPEIVIAEVREEAGFEVTNNNIVSLGSVMVSTQSNQMCNLYMVLINKEKQLSLQPENEMESLATVKWIRRNEIYTMQDWKTITIFTKYEHRNTVYQIVENYL